MVRGTLAVADYAFVELADEDGVCRGRLVHWAGLGRGSAYTALQTRIQL